MKEKIKWFLKNLINALFNNKEGFSTRKILAILLTKAGIGLSFLYTDSQNLTTVLMITYSAVALLLGIVTIANIIELKNGKQS